MIKKILHCCELMDEFVNDERLCVKYNPITREYFIPLKSSCSIQLLFYCPWCSRKLPDDLRRKLFEILEKEYSIEPDINVLRNSSLPQEFKSDAWWKKRGL